MLNVVQAAKHACVSEQIVRGWIRAGQLPHFRLGAKGKRGKIAIAIEDLNNLLASFKISKKEPGPTKTPVRKVVTAKLRHLQLPSA